MASGDALDSDTSSCKVSGADIAGNSTVRHSLRALATMAAMGYVAWAIAMVTSFPIWLHGLGQILCMLITE